MKRFSIALCFFLFLSPVSAQNADEGVARPHEVILAFGTASSPEKSVFNLSGEDVLASPDFSYYFGYYYSLTERLAVGAQIFGYTQSINNVVVIDASSTMKTVSFDLSPSHIGLQARYLLMVGTIQPFVSVMANVAIGSLSNNDYGTLRIFGFSAGGTAGLRVFLFEPVSLSVQGYAAFGSAAYKNKPFQNSVDDDFNPSMAGVIIGAAYHWGE